MRFVTDLPRKIREIENLWIPMRDACRLAARVWLPEDAETSPVPAIVEYIPYRKRDFTAYGDSFTHPWYAGHGYASIRLDLRGSGDSDGVLHDEYLPQEQQDALDALAWIAAQPWCTGKIGMMGISWGGFNALQVAALRPPQLKAIVTLCSTDDRYATDVHFMGGCLLKDGISWGSGIFTVILRPPDPLISGANWREKWLERLNNATVPLATWLRHQRRDAYWKHGSVCEDYGAIECAVYAVGGWVDGYSNAILRLLRNLRAPCKGMIGPWTHTYPHLGVPGEPVGFLQETLRWWDHWLKDIDTGVMAEPRLNVWMQERIAPNATMPESPGRWIAETTWPPRGIAPKTFHLNLGRLGEAAEPEVALGISSPQTTGTMAGEWCPLDSGGNGPEFQSDQRQDDGRSFCFDSPPLDERIEILGAPVVELAVAIDKPMGLVCARLCDVAPDGSSTRVSFGLLNLTHRDSHEHPTPLEPGRTYIVRIALDDTAYAFVPGHRIRLAVSTAYWPMVWPSPEPVTAKLRTGVSTLALPVRTPRPEDGRVPFATAEATPPLARTYLREPKTKRGYTRDFATGRTVYSHEEDRGTYRLDAIDLTLAYEALERYSITDDDPTEERTEMKRKVSLSRGTWNVRIETLVELKCDATTFHLAAKLEAFEGEERIVSKDWREVIPRDMM
ncbi:MAG: CocE/NonD family hydrolase [Alphaproteobacteria bacterium]